jgi:hypothetical protein
LSDPDRAAAIGPGPRARRDQIQLRGVRRAYAPGL